MPESIEEVHAGTRRSWTPLLMTLAFAIGAGVTGWIVFHDEIKEWARIEDMAWEPGGGERLTLVQHDRLRRTVTGEPDGIVSTATEWQVVPAARGRVPGQPAAWTQTLHGGTWELRSGDVVELSGVTLDPGAAPPEPTPHPRTEGVPVPTLPGDAAVLAWLAALDVGANIDAAGSTVTAAPSLEALEQIETRRTGKALEKRKPLEAPQIDALNADLSIVSQRIGFDLAACAPGDYYRPGQTWTREVALPIGEWGVHVVRLELEHQGYEGDVALVQGTLARKPVEGALTSEDGLSGLKGEITCRYDVAAHRMDGGHYTIEARGKSNRKFATLGIDHAFALAGPGETAAIPAAMDLAALPPPVVPTEPPPASPQPAPPRPAPPQPAPPQPPQPP